MSLYKKPLLALALAAATAGCAVVPEDMRRETLNAGDVPLVLSSKPTPNNTPLTAKLVCYGERLEDAHKGHIALAVGNIRDYTGKQNDLEGFLVTQGGALMAYTALGHLVPGVSLYERFDTQIADAELAYLSNRQLGDGRLHETTDAQTGQPTEVPWKPYYGGSILQSDFYIVGGITELNFNIQSGGGELNVNNVGGKGRIYTMNVGVDLRIVGTQTLKVYDTVSIQKQISGYEVGLDIFRFFDNDLWDVNAGAKNQEPLQLAVRMAIESAILDLVPSVTGVTPQDCKPAVPLVDDDAYEAIGGKAVTTRASVALESDPA
ncbi:CsgG/HfaB family protein [Marivita cryptomonadis]|uniref:CsgG/HfaB family protein n=1 Tax=Marivita cryptomonadis TaxID=505252 RepID=UPI0015945E41|nr:CsgG/HfaB family protein [Marivita cryptomonadis]